MKKTTVFTWVIVLFLFLCVYGYADYSQTLQGTWTTSCIDDDRDGIYRKITMIVSGNELSSTHDGSWTESECLNNSNFYSSTLTGTFSIGNDIDISEAKELDISVLSCTITWLTDDIVNYVNANSWYGITDFQKNVPRDISGKTHPNGSTYPSIGETFFSVIKIDENKAYLGTDDAGFILNEDYRSPTLESWFYTKDNSGIITGTVTDENTGNPIENVFVRLLQLNDQQNVVFHKNVYTNAIGEYRINDIADGSYTIYFNGPDDFNWKLYNNVTNPSAVTFCTISDSNILRDINAQLSDQSGKISGTVTDEAGNPIPNVTVFVKDPIYEAYYEFAITDQNGHYYISGLSNFKYLIHFVPHSQDYFSEYYNDASHKDMSTFISVTEPGLTDNTNAKLSSITNNSYADRIGLKDAIYALQVVSGKKPSSQLLKYAGTGQDTDSTGTSDYSYELEIQIEGNHFFGNLRMGETENSLELYKIQNGSIYEDTLNFYIIDSEFIYNFSLLKLNNDLKGGVVEISNGCHPWGGCEYGLSALTIVNLKLITDKAN